MKKTEFSITALKDAFLTLQEANTDRKYAVDAKNKLYIQDACVKRFEYTIETAWKLMKKFLKLQYGKSEKGLTINNIFRLMEGYGFITNWENWERYYEARNMTSHEYNIVKAREILDIVDDFVVDVEYLIIQFDKEFQGN